MSLDMDDAELVRELQKYGEAAVKITDKNRAICMKKLNHFRAREAMANRDSQDQAKRRSSRKSADRASIGRIPTSEQNESNGFDIAMEERNLRRRTIAVTTDKTPPKERLIRTTFAPKTPPTILNEFNASRAFDKHAAVTHNFDESPERDRYLSSTPVSDSWDRPQRSCHGIGLTRPAWDASDSEGESLTSSTQYKYKSSLPNKTFGGSSYAKFVQNGNTVDRGWQSAKQSYWSVSPRMILFAVAILFLVIAFLYLFTITPVKPLLIDGDESGSRLLEEVMGEMGRRNGRIICSNGNHANMWLSIPQISDIITQVGGASVNVKKSLDDLAGTTNLLSFGNEDYKVVSRGEGYVYMKLNEANLPLTCRIHRAIVNITWKIALAIASVVLLVMLLVVFWLLRQRHQRQKRAVQNMANEIISLVRNNDELARRDPTLQSFVSMLQVRDSLIPLTQREKCKEIWNMALTWLLENESRLKPCREHLDGQQVEAWRWVEPQLNYAKPHVDSATVKDAKVAVPRYEPKFAVGDMKVTQSCVKIYNLLSPDSFVLDGETRDAVLDKCGFYHGILHMGVDSTMEKGVIFMKCISESAAGQNYKLLHAWNHHGKLVSVRYFSPTAYRMMFPEADDSMLPLKSTNQAKRRLSTSRLE